MVVVVYPTLTNSAELCHMIEAAKTFFFFFLIDLLSSLRCGETLTPADSLCNSL